MSDQNQKKDGYIYVMSNPYINGVLKIGRSVDPVTRASQLQTTGVPEPFKIEFAMYVEDAVWFEKFLHEDHASLRVAGNREFFQCSLADVFQSISARWREDFHIIDNAYFARHGKTISALMEELELRCGLDKKTAFKIFRKHFWGIED